MVHMRFFRWRRKGAWKRMAHVVSDKIEIKRVLLDSTIVREHQHSAGAQKGDQQALDPTPLTKWKMFALVVERRGACRYVFE